MEKILLIRRDNIGDLICTTPAIRAVRLAHPGAKIGLFVNSYNAEIAASIPGVDEVYVYKKEKHYPGRSRLSVWAENLRVIRRVRAERYNVSVSGGLYSRTTARYSFYLGAERRIGYVRPGAGRSWAYTEPMPHGRPDVHEVLRTFELVQPLGAASEPGPMVLGFSELEAARCRDAMLAQFGPGRPPVLAVALSARIPRNRWGADRFGDLIERAMAELGQRVMILWAPGAADDPVFPGDDALAGQLTDRFGDGILAYRTRSLTELIAALAASDAVVTLDTGSLHMAAALQKPTLALMTEVKQPTWYPWMTRSRVVTHPEDVRLLTVEPVFHALRDLLAAQARAPRP
jgi:ADP-heptose:LPS heptosyltransferase